MNDAVVVGNARHGERNSPDLRLAIRDRGEVDGTSRRVRQVKTAAADFTDTAVLAMLDDTSRASPRGGDRLRHRRATPPRQYRPGRWHASITGADLHTLTATARNPDVLSVLDPRLHAPVRMLLREPVPLPHAAGFGNRP